jgi:hypothetical protein
VTAWSTDGRKVFARYADLLKRLATFRSRPWPALKGFAWQAAWGSCWPAHRDRQRRLLFGTPEVNVGLWPMMIGALIFRNVTPEKAMR